MIVCKIFLSSDSGKKCRASSIMSIFGLEMRPLARLILILSSFDTNKSYSEPRLVFRPSGSLIISYRAPTIPSTSFICSSVACEAFNKKFSRILFWKKMGCYPTLLICSNRLLSLIFLKLLPSISIFPLNGSYWLLSKFTMVLFPDLGAPIIPVTSFRLIVKSMWFNIRVPSDSG